MSAFIESKVARLLAEGRVRVQRVTGERVVASVEGDTGTYRVELSGGTWHCECPAHVECSHLLAVQLVTIPRVTVGPAPLPLPLLTVGTPPRVVLDDCVMCGGYGPTTAAGTCPDCG